MNSTKPSPQVRNHRLHKKQLITTNGKGREMAKKEDDRRRVLSKERCAKVNHFTKIHDDGWQVFQVQWGNGWKSIATVPCRTARWRGFFKGAATCADPGGSKPLRSPKPIRPTRIRLLLIEMNDGLAQEDEGRAIIAYMDGSFVHQLHSSAYLYFQRDKEGVVHSAFGRTSGKGQSSYGPCHCQIWSTRDP